MIVNLATHFFSVDFHFFTVRSIHVIFGTFFSLNFIFLVYFVHTFKGGTEDYEEFIDLFLEQQLNFLSSSCVFRPMLCFETNEKKCESRLDARSMRSHVIKFLFFLLFLVLALPRLASPSFYPFVNFFHFFISFHFIQRIKASVGRFGRRRDFYKCFLPPSITSQLNVMINGNYNCLTVVVIRKVPPLSCTDV